MLFLLFVALWFTYCFLFFFFFFFFFFFLFFLLLLLFFSICVVMLVLWSPSSIAAHFAFCFTSCVVMLAFWSSSTAAHYVFCFKRGIGTLGEVSRLLKCFKYLLLPLPAPVVYSTDRFMAVVPVLVLLFIALWVILRGGLFIILPCVILFLCFSVLLALQLPCLRKKELITVFFVRLFDLRLFGFVCFLFLLVSGKVCGLRLWHSLDFSLTYFFIANILMSLLVFAIPLYFSSPIHTMDCTHSVIR